MSLIKNYVVVLQNTLEKLSKSLYKKNTLKYNKISNKVDKKLLEKYRLIEKMIEEELKN